MNNLGEKIKEIIEKNNSILGWKQELKDLDKEKNSPFFELDKFLKKHYSITDSISRAENGLYILYKELK